MNLHVGLQKIVIIIKKTYIISIRPHFQRLSGCFIIRTLQYFSINRNKYLNKPREKKTNETIYFFTLINKISRIQ